MFDRTFDVLCIRNVYCNVYMQCIYIHVVSMHCLLVIKYYVFIIRPVCLSLYYAYHHLLVII